MGCKIFCGNSIGKYLRRWFVLLCEKVCCGLKVFFFLDKDMSVIIYYYLLKEGEKLFKFI